MYLVSACLTGRNCKYNGGNNFHSAVAGFCGKHLCLPLCPEAETLPTPRPPAEIRRGPGGTERVINRNGEDVTEAFAAGARTAWEEALAAAEKNGSPIEGAVLKANSPSCGCGRVYDGTFSGTLTDGDGLFCRILKENGIPVRTELDFNGKEETEGA